MHRSDLMPFTRRRTDVVKIDFGKALKKKHSTLETEVELGAHH